MTPADIVERPGFLKGSAEARDIAIGVAIILVPANARRHLEYVLDAHAFIARALSSGA